jgi:hypothetical protein
MPRQELLLTLKLKIKIKSEWLPLVSIGVAALLNTTGIRAGKVSGGKIASGSLFTSWFEDASIAEATAPNAGQNLNKGRIRIRHNLFNICRSQNQSNHLPFLT